MTTMTVDFDTSALKQYALKASAAILVFAAMVGVAHCGTGCLPANDPSTYQDEIIACAATAGYPGAYDVEADMRCRAEVNRKYGL